MPPPDHPHADRLLERPAARPLAGIARCPACDRPAIAPLVATHLGAGRVRNDWTCSGCGFSWSDRFDGLAA